MATRTDDTPSRETEQGLSASVVDRIATQLLNEIRQGRLPAGTHLVQGDIAARFGVSGTPVREAFYALEHLGLIRWDGRRGVRVFEPDVSDLVEVYNIRASLESLAVRLATARLDSEDLQRLDGLQTQLESISASDEEFSPLDAEFHHRLADRAGSPRLARLIDAQLTTTAAYEVFLKATGPDSVDAIHREHRAVLAAARTGDGELAAAAMSTHLTARGRALLGFNAAGSAVSSAAYLVNSTRKAGLT